MMESNRAKAAASAAVADDPSGASPIAADAGEAANQPAPSLGESTGAVRANLLAPQQPKPLLLLLLLLLMMMMMLLLLLKTSATLECTRQV